VALSHEELVLPLRSATALREEVAGRVQHRRRQRTRRRAVRLALSAAAAVVVVVLGTNGVPGARTGVDAGDRRSAPASEGDVVAGAQDAAPRAKTETGGVAAPAPTGSADAPLRPAAHPPANPAPSSRPPATGAFDDGGDGASAPVVGPVRMAVARPDGIWELDAAGASVRRLVENGSEPAWSPDGRRLAYTKLWEGVNGGVGVAVLDLDTMKSRYVLVGSGVDYRSPTWSPDGRRIAVTRVAASAPLEPSVLVADADDGGNRVDLGPGDGPHWAPDDRIVHRCGDRLCVRWADGRTAEVPGSDDLTAPAWSPEGRLAAWDKASQKVVALRVDGSDRRVVASGATGAPAWSPDGARLVFPTAEGLRSARIDGSDRRVVTDRPLDADPDLVAG
jgi:hypothetical protein